MNVKDMLRQASDAAKQLITLSDQTIIGSTDSYGGGTRRESPRSGTYGPSEPEIRPAEINRGKATRYRRRYGECIDITFSIK